MNDFPINPVDLAVIVVVVGSGLIALARGFAREVLSLVGWIGAALVTLWGFSLAQPYAQRLIDNAMIANIAAGLTLFLISLVVFSLVGHGLASLVRNSALSALDRSLGFLFGLARGVVLLGLAWLALAWAVPPADRPAWIVQARTRPLLESTAELLQRLAPPEFRLRAQAAGTEIDEKTRQIREFRQVIQAPGLPQTKPPASDGETGYKADDRRGLEGLIQRTETPEQRQPPR